MGTSVISVFIFFYGVLGALCILEAKVSSEYSMGADRRHFTRGKTLNIPSIKEHLRSLNRAAAVVVKTIRSSDGDTIDCIPRSQQLAFQHPLLKDHKLQEAPTTVHHRSSPPDHAGQVYRVPQVWQQHGTCPNGTIPVKRITADDIVRMGSSSLKQQHDRGEFYYEDPQTGGGPPHEHSYGRLETGAAYYGTRATISIWNPYVQLPTEFSLAQLWVVGSSPNNLGSTLEAGWQVCQLIYGDNKTRLFTYWTGDGYQSTGCYNLLCPGFVQISNSVLLGGALSRASTLNGSQYEMSLLVYKDSKTGNWWLEVNGESVGYWPHNLTYLTTNYATILEWGGEIVNSEQNGRHTTTQMGSGKFAKVGYNHTAYIKDIQWVDMKTNLYNISNLQTYAENFTCYNVLATSHNSFLFGGPGRSRYCL